ncbi:MAG: hypothetical protein ACRCYU_15940 [Nocardioides sp.]
MATTSSALAAAVAVGSSLDTPHHMPAVLPPSAAARVRAVAAVEAARVLLLAAGDTADARCDRRTASRCYDAAGELAWLQAVTAQRTNR